MNAPPRLLEGGSELETALLRAGRSERPSRDGMKRAVAAASAAAIGTTAIVAAKSGVVGIKVPAWLCALGLGVTLTAAGVAIVTTAPRPAMVVEAPPSAPVVGPVSPAPPEPASVPVTPVVAPPLRKSPARALPSASPSASPPTEVVERAEDELTLLRRAKARVAASDGDGALDLLDVHGKTHPHGALSEEAAALRVEALATKGDAEGARRAAAVFLARYPTSPYEQRVRRFVR